MSKQRLLIALEPSAPSVRQKLTELKKCHGIQTHRCANMSREDLPWLALIPFDEDKGKDVAQIMAESCRLYEDSGWLALDTGELSAVRKLCKQMGILCPL